MRQKRSLLIKVSLGLGLLAAVAVVLGLGLDLKGLVLRGLDLIRGAGPVAYFTAMALVPAAGVPLSAFTLTAGPVFGERFGMPAVVALSLAAITFNLLLTYWLALRALRPLLQRLIDRLGYRMPEVESGDATDLMVIMRVTPGVPFFIQNYLCGLAQVPFGRYLLVSCLTMWSYGTAFVVFGEALRNGKGWKIMLAVSVIVALVAVTHLVRRHYGRKKSAG
jgi:uncharacterized membrane protein YdjX (TVP38/TMEM64 family)